MSIEDLLLRKLCRKCKNSKKYEEFYYVEPKNRSPRFSSVCKNCVRLRLKNLYPDNKEKILENLSKRKKKDPLKFYIESSLSSSIKASKLYGYAPCNATKEELRKAWTGRCYLCGITNEDHIKKNKVRLSTDHCHKTGKFRAFVCLSCNKLIACLEMSKELIEKAIKLIEDNKE